MGRLVTSSHLYQFAGRGARLEAVLFPELEESRFQQLDSRHEHAFQLHMSLVFFRHDVQPRQKTVTFRGGGDSLLRELGRHALQRGCQAIQMRHARPLAIAAKWRELRII